MNASIVKQLNRKARPDGLFNFKWILRMNGSDDFRQSQVCVKDDSYLTPDLLERMRCLSEYTNKIYGKVDKSLEPVAITVASECKELELLSDGSVPEGLDPENQERMAASLRAKSLANEKRRNEILIHMSEIRLYLNTLDAALKHHLERAENVVMKHVSSYWSGVLKAAADPSMPVMPDVAIPEVPGKAVYEEHLSHLMETLNRVLAESQEVKNVIVQS